MNPSNSIRSRGLLAALAALGLVVAAAGVHAPAAAQASADEIAIHHIGPLSGSGGAAAPSKEFLSGAQLVLARVNAAGGVGGRQIKLHLIDDEQDAKKTEALFRQHAASGRMLAMFMPRTSPSIRAAIKVSEETGVPIIAPQTGGSFITDPTKRSVFAVRASYRTEVERAVEHFHTLGLGRFAMLRESGPFGDDVQSAFAAATGRLQLKATNVQVIDSQAVDVPSAVHAAAMSDRPEVVFLCIGADAAAGFIRRSKAQGMSAQFVSLSNTSTAGYVKLLGELGRGVMVMQVVPPPLAAKYPVARRFVEEARRQGTPLSHGALQGYISAEVLVAGLRRAGPNFTPESLIRALEAIGHIDVGGYEVTFNSTRREGSRFVNPTLISSDGSYVY